MARDANSFAIQKRGEHKHNEGESHELELYFDQLFGGASSQWFCIYGRKTQDGVTVIYNYNN